MSWSAFDAFGNDAEAPGASSSAPTPSGASTGDFDVFAAFDPFAASAPAKLAASKPSSSAARDLFDIFGSPELSPLEAAPTRGPETASTFHAEDSPAVLDAFADFAHAENASGNVGFASPTLEGPASAAASALGSPPVGRSSVGSSDNVNSGFAEVGFEAFAAEFPQASTAEVSFAAFDAPTFEAFGSRAEPGGSADFAAFEAPPRPQAPLTEKPKQPFGEGREAARHGGRSAPSRSAAASAGSDNAAFSFAFDDGILSLPVDARESAVFRWLHNVELALRPLAKADLKPIQTGLEATLLRILTMESPKPTLPAAHSISRIFTQLYSSGDRRTVFDTVSALERILSPPAKAPPPPVVVRVAVSFVLGMLTMGFGDSVGSLFAGTAAALVKNTKSGIDGVLRCESYYALARSLEGSGRSASEPTAKDIAKAAREAIRDRSIAVRTAACDCLDSLLKNTVHLRPAKIDDLDSLLHPLMRYTLENSNYSLRRSVAALIGTVLAFALVPPLPPVDAKKRGGEPTSTRPMMSLGETLTFYAQYLIKHPTPTVRVGIVEGYAAFFRQCGQAFVEANYAEIAIHIVELSCHPKLCTSKSATLATREWCTYLLRNVLAKMLSEAGQNQAIRILNDGWLKRWPPAAGTPGPSKAAVVTVLMEVASLLNDVGPAASNVAEVVEPLGNLLNHLSKSVNTAVCWTLRSVCLSAPQNIAKLIARIVPWLKKEVANLTPDQPDRTKRFRGYALALASLISVVPCRPLYVSFELCAKVLALAVHLLKLASQGKSFRIVGIQAEVAWILIASLMCLGPDFCKVHLQQIVTFWRSHFERYGSKLLPRSDGELQMYLQVTDAALIALRTFLEFNGKELLNAELDKKVSFWLHEAQVALDATRRIGKAAPTKAGNSGEAPEEDLAEQECHIRARLYRCCCLLYQLGSFEASAPLMASIVGTLAPEHGDALATSYVRGLSFTIAGNVATEDRGINRILLRDLDVQTIEEQAERFLGSTPENDASAVFFQKVDLAAVDPRRVECPMVPPASIDAVDAAIDAFGQLFVAVGSSVQEKILEDLLRTVKRSAKGPVDPMVNALGGVFSALKHAVARQGNVVTGRVPELLRELVFMGLFHDHSSIRALASESIGRLAQVVNSSSFTSSLTQQLVQAIVDVREPNTRAGAALGLGSIQCYGGSLSGIPQLKTGFGILQSLAMDAHPTVHTWALVGILLMVEGSGLMFGSNVQATLDLIYKVLCSDGHHLGAAGNAEGNEYIGPILGRILSATLNVIGPELADKSKAVRDMCFAQYEEMRYQSDPFIAVEALKCAQQFMLFDPTHLDTASLVPYMQALLAQDVRSQVRVLRKACVTCLYQMAKRNPERLLLQADSLEEQLFGLLDTEGEAMVRDEIKDVLRELVRFSATKAPSRWIDLCKRILSASTAAAAVAPAADAVQASSNADAGDDDSSMLDAQTGETGTSTVHAAPTIAAAIMLLPRWRTHIFAMACIRQLLHEVVASGQREHVDLLVARSRDEEHGKRSDFFIYRMADVIRIAFSAATAPVQDLRLSGLDLLQDVLESFGQVQDPDFEGHSLLEQYQAQISSALSPAMTSDSSAEVSSAACRVSAVYLASGINQDLSTLSRVLRLLQELLAKIAAEKGDGSDPQPHASAMVRLAVQGAWARLLMSTVHGDILRPVVQPHQATLAKLWFKTLREYGRLSLENDVLRSLGGFPLTIDVGSSLTYLEATRNVILPFYTDNWVYILRALSIAVEVPGVLETLSQLADGSLADADGVLTILCGLCLRAVASEDKVSSGTKSLPREQEVSYSLLALKSFLGCGGARFLEQEFALNETLAVLDRLVDTSPPSRDAVATILDIALSQLAPESVAAEAKTARNGSMFLKIFADIASHHLLGFGGVRNRFDGWADSTVVCTAAAFSSWIGKMPPEFATRYVPLWLAVVLASLVPETDQERQSRLLVGLAVGLRSFATWPDKDAQLASGLVRGEMMALLTRKNSSDERRATVFKALTVVCVTLPQVVADATILQPIVEAMENVLAYGGIESASAALRFANGAFGLARSESQLVSATGRRLIRRLGPLLFDFALARANRVHTEPLADAATVPVELLLQVLASAAACLPADGERSAFLAANVDLLARLLAPTSSTDEERYEPRHISSQSKQLQRTVSQALMQLAVSDPAGFRGVVGMVDVATKNRLQAALEAGQQRKAPSIALKSFA